MNINIDMTTASVAENTRFKGFGLISANNSSRLLLDYKYEQPERYDEILNYLFGKDWLDISHIKVEQGNLVFRSKLAYVLCAGCVQVQRFGAVRA